MIDLPHKPRRGETLDVDIDRVAPDGYGEALLDARIGPQRAERRYRVRARRALPGDRVRVRVERVRRGQVEGGVVEWLERAQHRVEPRCEHFGQREQPGKGCGGCTLQPLPHPRQLELKRELVLRALGDARGGVEVPPVRSVAPWFYRNKMELSFGDDRARRFALGLHPWGYRREVFALRACYLMSPELARVAAVASHWAERRGVPAYRARDDSGFLRTLTVREGKRTGERLVELTTASVERVALAGGEEHPAAELAAELDAELAAAGARPGDDGFALTSFVWTRQHARRGERTRFIEQVLRGPGTLRERLRLPGGHELCFEIHPRAFFQPNTLGAELLYAEVIAAAGLGEGEGEGSRRPRVLDLYCGTGTIALCLAPYAEQVSGIELSREAVANAERNAAANGLDNARFFAGDVAKVLAAQPELSRDLDVVVVDPPRAGLAPRALELVVATAAPRLVYVSCNPEALGRDLALLAEHGYTPRSIQPVDMFPQTAHVETVVALAR